MMQYSYLIVVSSSCVLENMYVYIYEHKINITFR